MTSQSPEPIPGNPDKGVRAGSREQSQQAVSAVPASIPDAATFIQCGEPCDHDFQGWREFDDGLGGERVCAKCGLGAMAHTLSLDF